MEISIRSDVPDGTYFTTEAVTPWLSASDTILNIYDGDGTRRSWGRPGVTSTVVLNAPDLVAVHIGWHHKHGGGQCWRYFAVNGEVRQVEWKDLDDATRQVVLDAYDEKAPGWARIPGKVRTAYRRPVLQTRTSYKLVALDGDRFVSLYDGHTEYALGRRNVEAARPGHHGGFYSYPDPHVVMHLWQEHDLVNPARHFDRLALLECEISGTIIDYGEKLASTYLRPLQIMQVIDN